MSEASEMEGAEFTGTITLRDMPGQKRYLLFAGNEYFALGGWRDMQAGFSDLTTAMNAVSALPEEQWVQLVDLQTMQPIVSRGEAYGTTIDNPFAPPA